MPLSPLPAHVDLPKLEHEVLERWQADKVFERSLEQSAGNPTWMFYEGPPTANGTPGVHHVEARVFKDVFPRFRTMKGYHVPRKAGWDCHGLPVEIAVEKELGFAGKPDIERYGIAEFNARCRESVLRHVDEFTVMTERMGYWVDVDDAYWTMDRSYVESVWWSLKQVFDKGLLVEDHRVTPYCPRCGTGLSDHEVAQGYETVVDPSVYVRFPVTSGPAAPYDADFLVWTTTPWTLVSNTAVAVNPRVEYVVARSPRGTFVVAEPLLAAVLGEDRVEVLDRFPGTALERSGYRRPFDLVEIPGAHYVILADYVTTEDGTGLVHQSPAFGAEDLAATRAYGLPVVNPIEPDGHFRAGIPLVGGLFFKDADPPLVADLRERGLLFREQPYEHAYPHCWRCHTALLYYALPSWYVRTTAVKDQLLAENERTTWYPETVKHGRYGDWLNNNVDWALSRDRYWGTPLPVWRCPDGHDTCVGSLAQLGSLAGRDLSTLDPHRPFVDEVTITCPSCGVHAHQQPGRRGRVGQGHHLAGRGAAAVRVAVDADLHQHVERVPLGPAHPVGQGTDQLGPVERVHHRRVRRHRGGLVALQPADEVPAGLGHLARLDPGVLVPVFPEVRHAEPDQPAGVLGRERLGDPDQRELARVAARRLGRRGHPVPHLREVGRDLRGPRVVSHTAILAARPPARRPLPRRGDAAATPCRASSGRCRR